MRFPLLTCLRSALTPAGPTRAQAAWASGLLLSGPLSLRVLHAKLGVCVGSGTTAPRSASLHLGPIPPGASAVAGFTSALVGEAYTVEPDERLINYLLVNYWTTGSLLVDCQLTIIIRRTSSSSSRTSG